MQNFNDNTGQKHSLKQKTAAVSLLVLVSRGPNHVKYITWHNFYCISKYGNKSATTTVM
jgi:hypothetical protein